MIIPASEGTLAAQLPSEFVDVPYVGSRFPGSPGGSGITGGANCQLYAYAVLAHFGVAIPTLRSSELATDDRLDHVSGDEVRPLDLVMYGPTPDPVGAHVGVIVGEDAVLHLCAELNRPAIWTARDFAARDRYRCRVGVRRCRPGVLAAAAQDPILATGASQVDLAIRERRKDRHRPVVVAIDGRSGTGKSTFGTELAHRQGGQIITADDFFSGGDSSHWQALSAAERAAGVIDWQRLRTEVLEPLRAGLDASWQPFDFSAGQGLSQSRLGCSASKPVIVLDGAYSSRPELADLVDVTVLLTLNDDKRRSRLLAREGQQFMRRWHEVWDAAEDHYFGNVRPPGSFDLVLPMDVMPASVVSDGEDAHPWQSQRPSAEPIAPRDH